MMDFIKESIKELNLNNAKLLKKFLIFFNLFYKFLMNPKIYLKIKKMVSLY